MEVGKGIQKLIGCVSGKDIYFDFKLCRKRGITKKKDDIIARKVLKNSDISELFACIDRKPFSTNSQNQRVSAWDGINAKSSFLYGAKSAERTGAWLTMSEDVDREVRLAAQDESIFRPSPSATPEHELYVEGKFWRFRDHSLRINFLDV